MPLNYVKLFIILCAFVLCTVLFIGSGSTTIIQELKKYGIGKNENDSSENTTLFVSDLTTSLTKPVDTTRSSISLQVKNESDEHVKKEMTTFRIVGPRQWIINNFIAQFSSRLIIKDDVRLIFETLAFYDSMNQNAENLCANLAFLVMFSREDRIFIRAKEAHRMATIINVAGVGRYLWKVKSEILIDVGLFNLSEVVFLLTDREEYQHLHMRSQDDLNGLLSFHKPYLMDARKKKKPAIAHCVHNVRNLNKQRIKQMKTWLTVQQRLGIDYVKLYFYNEDKTAENEIKQIAKRNVEKMKIEIIDFRLFNNEIFLFYSLLLVLKTLS